MPMQNIPPLLVKPVVGTCVLRYTKNWNVIYTSGLNTEKAADFPSVGSLHVRGLSFPFQCRNASVRQMWLSRKRGKRTEENR